MSTKVFDVFEEYSALEPNRKFRLAGGKDYCWFRIYVFSKEAIDLVNELDILNSLLVSQGMNEYGEFSVCLDPLLIPDWDVVFLSRKRAKE